MVRYGSARGANDVGRRRCAATKCCASDGDRTLGYAGAWCFATEKYRPARR